MGSAFIADAVEANSSGIDFWEATVANGSPPGEFPLIGHNGTAQAIVYANTVHAAAGELFQHPGPDGEYSDLRFTVPATGFYAINCSFVGIDVTPTTTDVHILLDGSSLLSGAVNSYGSGPSFSSGGMKFNQGDTLDFAVGYGSNLNFYFDSTGLSVDIAPVPEPATLSVVALAVAALLSRRRRPNSLLPQLR